MRNRGQPDEQPTNRYTGSIHIATAVPLLPKATLPRRLPRPQGHEEGGKRTTGRRSEHSDARDRRRISNHLYVPAGRGTTITPSGAQPPQQRLRRRHRRRQRQRRPPRQANHQLTTIGCDVPRIHATVNGRSTTALIGSGASTSCVRQGTFAGPSRSLPQKTGLRLASGDGPELTKTQHLQCSAGAARFIKNGKYCSILGASSGNKD